MQRSRFTLSGNPTLSLHHFLRLHSWGVPHCHCPLEIPYLSLSLGDVATPATIPSAFELPPQYNYAKDPQTGQAHVHTRCKAQSKVVFFNQLIQYIIIHSQHTLHVSNPTSPRRNPSSLVNVLDPPRAAALVPADITLVPQLPPYQPVFATNPVVPLVFPASCCSASPVIQANQPGSLDAILYLSNNSFLTVLPSIVSLHIRPLYSIISNCSLPKGFSYPGVQQMFQQRITEDKINK